VVPELRRQRKQLTFLITSFEDVSYNKAGSLLPVSLMLRCLLPALLLFSSLAYATDSRVCAPFRDGAVDQGLVAEMLEAAKDGHLYRIHSTTSRVGFCVDSLIGRVEAEFKGFRGGLALRREVWGDESQMLVMIDADSLKTEPDFIKDMLKSDRFLHAQQFPKILFVSTALKWDSETTASLYGMLTMHGISKPVRFRLEITDIIGDVADHEQEILVTGHAYIRRSDFGMNRLPMLVSDEVELCMRVSALRYQADM
jgi:polyisoprenoid-binding protein YceI